MGRPSKTVRRIALCLCNAQCSAASAYVCSFHFLVSHFIRNGITLKNYANVHEYQVWLKWSIYAGRNWNSRFCAKPWIPQQPVFINFIKWPLWNPFRYNRRYLLLLSQGFCGSNLATNMEKVLPEWASLKNFLQQIPVSALPATDVILICITIVFH